MCVYLPLRQTVVQGVTLYVRAAGDPTSILAAVQRELHNTAPAIEVSDVRTGAKLIGQVLFFQTVGVAILAVFGLLAVVLASIGLYGLQAYPVNRRHREIGERMAMGAGRSDVLRLILRQGMSLVAVGVAVGLPLSVMLGQTMSRMLFGVNPYDPVAVTCSTGGSAWRPVNPTDTSPNRRCQRFGTAGGIPPAIPFLTRSPRNSPNGPIFSAALACSSASM